MRETVFMFSVIPVSRDVMGHASCVNVFVGCSFYFLCENLCETFSIKLPKISEIIFYLEYKSKL